MTGSGPPPTMFGPYQLLELLGRGGMGEVWRAYDTRRERTVALKRLTDGWAHVPAFQARFRLEARATARLQSEHVIVIHDYGEIDGRLFIDMRLVSGGDLAQALAATGGAGLGVERSADLCVQIADGLDAAHRDHLVHRDVKPSNVLLAPDGARQRAYLVDFGIAKIADEATGAGLTATGVTVGTPAYMAPELFGEGGPSPASDVYALGCVTFEMLTGRRVFTSTSAAALMAQHVYEPPPAPSSVRPELAPYDPVLSRALDKTPTHRHPTAGALATDITDATTRLRASPGPPPTDTPSTRSAAPADGPPRTLVAPARHPMWTTRWILIAAAAAVAVMLGIVGLAVAVSGPDSSPASVPSTSTSSGPSSRVSAAFGNPTGIAFSPDGRRAYVADAGPGALLTLDVATGMVRSSAPVGDDPSEVALSPDGRRAYVTNAGTQQNPGHTLSVVDTASDAVVATVPVGAYPLGAVVSRDNSRVYVADSGTDSQPGSAVTVVDTASNTVFRSIPVGTAPNRLGISADGSRVYVADFGSNGTGSAVTVIDTATDATQSLPTVDIGPVVTVPAPDGRNVYVLCAGATGTAGSVVALDTVTGASTSLGNHLVDNPITAALTPDGRSLVVANYGTDDDPGSTVSVIDTTTKVNRHVLVDGRPYGVAITPDGRTAWVTTSAAVTKVPL